MTARTRSTLGKKLRFEIFRRDGFTCKYCGAQPPAVVLEVDHIEARSRGGSDDPTNLITSCSHCNAGKGALRIEVSARLRPDADLDYLEVQQETVEVERYLASKERRDRAESLLLDVLREEWQKRLPEGYAAPTDRVLRNWLSQFPAEDIEEAIRRAGPYGESGYLEAATADSYVFGILRRVHRERAKSQSQSQ
jgi:hypothetical protein